jgi:glycosyltransferase involved in cell wall biosynthesis
MQSQTATATDGLSPHRLLFLVTEDWYFWAHRLTLARAARDAGYAVTVATRVDKLGEALKAEGFAVEPLVWVRGSVNPFWLAADVVAIARLYRRLRPHIVHHVSLKPVVLGSFAALFCRGVVVLNALTGLGYTFTARSLRARVLAGAVRAVLRPLLRRKATITLLENDDDRRVMIEQVGVPAAQTAVNRGSGVDLARFSEMPLPDGDLVTVACASRMLGIKGIGDLVAASRMLQTQGIPHRLILAGDTDPENPDAIPEATLRGWVARDGVEWLGHVSDVKGLWQRTDIAVLASLGGEGVPLSLVEAAACGRPLVATDVPGSRDIARKNVNALLVPPGDPAALAGALAQLIQNSDMRRTFAAASRAIAASGFSSETIVAATLALYQRLLAEAVPPVTISRSL